MFENLVEGRPGGKRMDSFIENSLEVFQAKLLIDNSFTLIGLDVRLVSFRFSNEMVTGVFLFPGAAAQSGLSAWKVRPKGLPV